MIVKYRPWLDAARLVLLITAHIGMLDRSSVLTLSDVMCVLPGVAAAFAVNSPNFACPETSEFILCTFDTPLNVPVPAPDGVGECRLFNVYILIANLVVPTLRKH